MAKCIIIDDEELARVLLKTYVDKLDYLELVASFDNPLDAISTLESEPIDVVFLDIQMPDLKGTEFAKIIPAATKIIFTTAYSEYALQGYELNALDYLVKPITFERFLQAVAKVKAHSGTVVSPSKEGTITVKSGYDLHKLLLEDITHIESDSEYVLFHTTDKKIMSHQTLKSLEKSLDSSQFMRVHRSFIVNKAKVTGLKGRDLILTTITIPVSDSYYDLVKRELFES
ncbi:LytTR family DNA-binding domain-containing protein [Cellulophaga sp. F20128]|uniref:LytR/AlgR family response regulator transcription factor n=1 Tax=Cellulophaga sp. F20128 TaxID=2926413 RepID=UPI001FF3137B|nr:LytTR family DNA-binding domain-containing protein [Cellulophaga sp. F20128]MCK0156775.1 LytTR family DNA-binding domain-containing protein [Cellulophaga sp. F20128]